MARTASGRAGPAATENPWGHKQRHQSNPPVWRAPEDRAVVPVGGGRAWPDHPATPSTARLETAAGPAGPGRASRRRTQPHASDQAPPMWRAPEGPEGTGGLRDRPLRAAGSRVAISRAAGPEGARNTSGVHQAARPRKRAGRPRGGRARRRPEHRRSTQSSAAQKAGGQAPRRPDPKAPGTPPGPERTALTLRRRRARGVRCS